MIIPIEFWDVRYEWVAEDGVIAVLAAVALHGEGRWHGSIG